MPIVGLKTLELSGEAPSMNYVDLAVRAYKKRVFTEAQWQLLNTLPTHDLLARIGLGDEVIKALNDPSMLNMTPQQAAMISSNLRFQQDAIRRIIKSREG